MDGDAQISIDAERILQAQTTMLRGYLRHLVASADDAEDLAQEVCLEVLKNPQMLMRGDDCGAYLRGVARHLASRHHRRIQRDALLEEFIELAWHKPIAPEATSAGEQLALSACLEQMPEKTRNMVLWRYDDGLTSSEIATRMSTSSEAIRMALARARQALSKCIKQRLAALGGA
jgi:RNA polymerase sigma factor (sigma-70 family)